MATRALNVRFGATAGAAAAVAAASLLGTLVLLAWARGLGGPAPAPGAVSLPVLIHLGAALPALPLGAWLLLRRKGDRPHRLLGRLWAALMAVVAVSSFWLTGLTDGLGPIHLFSLLTLASLPAAVLAARAGKMRVHMRIMRGLYIGLVVAGLFAFMPGRLLHISLFG